MATTDEDGSARAAPAPVGPRRPYASPELIEYGSIAKLTQSGGRTRNELIFISMNRMGCL